MASLVAPQEISDKDGSSVARFWYRDHKTNKAICPSGGLTSKISSFDRDTSTLWLLHIAGVKLWDNFTE